MTEKQWQAAWELFHHAVEMPSDERRRFLSSVSSDPDVRAEVFQLLEHHDSSASSAGPSPEPLRVDRINTTFGRYRITRRLGRGGMGEVYAARDEVLGREVALKLVAPEAVQGRSVERLVREAKLASALNHPNIVTVHEVVESESMLGLILEFVPGTTLRELCREPVSVQRLADIGGQAARALAAAHAHGIVHRDIKPENIMLRDDGYVKVLDFGLARVTAGRIEPNNQSSFSGLPAGTLRYMSPEQLWGAPLTGATDVFSLGIVLYELATGCHPFNAGSPFETAHRIAHSEPQPLLSRAAGTSAGFDRLVHSMLAKEPAARPGASEVVRQLRELQQPQDTPGRRSVTSPAGRGLWKWVATGAVLAGIVAIWYGKERLAGGSEFTFRQVTTLVPENRATAAAISPDGQRTAYANVDGVFLRSTRTGETSTVRTPRDFIVDRLAWFADGTKLLASGFSATTYMPGVWTISLTGALPRLLRAKAREAVPSPDGTRIAFLSQDRSEIWVMGASGEDPRRMVAGPGDHTFPLVFWSPDSRRLAYQRRQVAPERQRPNLPERVPEFDTYYARSYESMDLATGRVLARVPDMWIESAAALPDGRILFLRWDAPGSSFAHDLWEVQTDPRTGAFLGVPRRFGKPIDRSEHTRISGMSASADGARVLMLRHFDQSSVFVADFALAPPRISNVRRLTFDEESNFPHAWTADSRAVIFESGRRKNYDLFRQETNQRTPEVIVATPSEEVLPQLGPDGRWVLYMARAPGAKALDRKLMRVPLEGGTPEEVPIGGPLDEFACALNPGTRCVLRITAQGDHYAFYDLDPVRGKGRLLARTEWTPGVLGDWAISPDGKQIAIPNHSSREGRIRVVELEPPPGAPAERELVLNGVTDLSGLVSATDGHAWFVSVKTTVGNRLLYVTHAGKIHSLGDIQGWAVPSPDGRRVAFLNRNIATNAWVVERR